ncbi:MAG: phosphoadenosine phosphosulfate reductase family protein [Dysgonomonas sp.]|uniref:phosphoadenosine phosphosulfate reductase domain-containing protein n=1 Tax=Dysgonomonas sp. TaxID=1891233 RepID=UPI0039E5B9D9
MKRKLLVSFSGGHTSAFMTKWCIDNLSNQYEIVVVFANTGKEREETLQFVNECDKRFNFNTVWVEAVVNPEKRKATTFKVVSFKSASRNGEPFESVIKKYGIPNVKFLHCTRELKERPIHKYIRSLGWINYYTAIGIRVDEIDRVNRNYKKQRFIYPLINMISTNKADINYFWNNQEFRLNLKSFEGNCDLCYKKSDRKLLTLLSENEDIYRWWYNMEKNYRRLGNNQGRFFRKNRSVIDLLRLSKSGFIPSVDESICTSSDFQLKLFDELDISNGCEESCEPFSIGY